MSIDDLLFQTTKLNKIDLLNVRFIDEFVIIEENEKDLYIDMFRLTEDISFLNEGKFTISINNKFLICFKSFEKEVKDLFINYIKKYEKSILEQTDIQKLNNILNLSKLILIFIPEFVSIYNLIIKILMTINSLIPNTLLKYLKIEKNQKVYFETLLELFKFTNLINGQNRKCAYSWFFRFEILKFLYTFVQMNQS
jgi:hypothetical protein